MLRWLKSQYNIDYVGVKSEKQINMLYLAGETSANASLTEIAMNDLLIAMTSL